MFRISSKASQCTPSPFLCAPMHCMRWLERGVTLFQVGWFYSVLLVLFNKLVLRKWSKLWLSRLAISSHDWATVTSGCKWPRVRGKDQWIVLTIPWIWTMIFLLCLVFNFSSENRDKIRKIFNYFMMTGRVFSSKFLWKSRKQWTQKMLLSMVKLLNSATIAMAFRQADLHLYDGY